MKYGDPQVDVPIRRVEGDGHLNNGYQIVAVSLHERELSRAANHRCRNTGW